MGTHVNFVLRPAPAAGIVTRKRNFARKSHATPTQQNLENELRPILGASLFEEKMLSRNKMSSGGESHA
jgi:hypothetical protein